MTSIDILCIKPKKNDLVFNVKNLVMQRVKVQQPHLDEKAKFVLYMLPGNWYEVYSKVSYETGEYKFGVLDVCSYKYDTKANCLKEAFCDKKSINYKVVFSEEYLQEFIEVLSNCLKNSLIKKIIVDFHIQDRCPEKIMGTFKLKSFINLLKNNNICYNISYIITQ